MKCQTCNGTGQVPDDMETRKEKFIESIKEANRTLFMDKKMLNDFYFYWTECGGKKMRFEKEKTWNVKRRLERWKRTSKVYDKKAEDQKFKMPGSYLKDLTERL